MSVIIEPFHEWEAKHRLLGNKSVGNFKYWDYMRRDMIMSFSDENNGVEPPFYKNMKERPKGKIDLIRKKTGDFAFFFRNPMKTEVKNADVLFLCHRRRQRINDRMVSIYSDYIADCFPNSLTVERGDTRLEYSCPRYSKNLVFSGSVELMSYIYRYLMRFFKKSEYEKIKDKVIIEMAEAFRDLAENYNLHVDPENFAERVTTLYYFYKFRKPRYKAFLRNISPKVIVEVVGGGFDAKIINEIAKEIAIPTIELQHGTGAMRVVYPERNIPVAIAPDWYFTFSDYWKSLVLLPGNEDHVFAAGFPYHEIEMKDYPKEKRRHDKNTVIFLSSRKYGKELSELAVKLSALDKDLHIIFKLHPREFSDWRENYKSLSGSNIDVVDNQNNGLYEYFAMSSAQIGVESTALFEGFSFELDTYIFDIPPAKITKKMLCESGYAEAFSTAEELYEKLINRGEKVSSVADFFWKEKSMETIVAKICEIGNIEGK